MIKFLTLFHLFLLSNLIWAQQETDSIIITDRPDLTESSITVPYKSIQLETGLLVFVDDASNTSEFKTTLYQFPAILIRYGLFKNIELRVFNQFVKESVNNPLIPNKERSTYGIDNLQLGTKINLVKENGIWPEIAILSHVVLPLGSANFKNAKTLANIVFSLSHTVSNRFSIGYNLGWTTDGVNQNGSGTYTFAMGYGVSKKVGCYLEMYGLLKNMESLTIGFDGGFTYLISNNMQLDLSAGRGVSENNYFFSAGYSVLIR